MVVDAMVLALLAIADIGLMVHLRRSHGRRVRADRMMASLRIALEREAAKQATVPEAKRWKLYRAS